MDTCSPTWIHTVPHGLDPLAAEDAKDDHERVKEVGEVPQRHGCGLRKLVHRVVASEQLHSHDGEDEDDDRQHEAEVAESAQRSADDTHQ